METFETKFDLLDAAYKDDELKKSTVALLQYLVYKSNQKQCFPAVETIAKAMNVCKRTVQYNMRKLEAAGYIIRKDRYYNHQQLSNSYEFNLGIKEEKIIHKRYSNQDNRELNELLTKSSSSSNNCELSKLEEIRKIYNMDLSKYEKLLMIYFVHRANKSALIYDDLDAYSNAIGVCRITMIHLLNSLRNKGIILVRSKRIGSHELITIKLTRIMYDNRNMESIQNKQNKSADQRRDMGNLCANNIKRNNLHVSWNLPGDSIKYIRRLSGRFLKQIRRVLFRHLKKKKKFLSDFFKLIGSIFSLE
ncbi:MAG: helix-turn-helix domain-containing protein [Lachnospiraceae bacterium]